MHNHYTTEERQAQLHVIMLSPSTTGSSQRKHSGMLYFYVNQPFDAVMKRPVAYAFLYESVPGIQKSDFGVVAIEPFLHMAAIDTAIPHEDNGIVLRFKFEDDVENPTEVVAALGKQLSELLHVDLRETKISGRYGQAEPASYDELVLMDFDPEYLDVNSDSSVSTSVPVMALAAI